MNYNIIGYILKNMHSEITIDKLSNDLNCSISTCARLIDYKNPYKRAPISIKFDTYLNVFLQYKKEYYLDYEEKAFLAIINILNNINYDFTNLGFKGKVSYDANELDYNMLVILMLNKAAEFYQSATFTPFSNETQNNNDSIKFQTYFDLLNIGLNAMDIANQIMINDSVLYEEWGEHFGTAEQWCEHIVANPENWGFLCKGKRIIGNWSFIILTEEQEKIVKSGNYLERDFKLENTGDIYENQIDEQAIYLLNMSVNNGFQTKDNQTILWKEFGKRLHQLIVSGIFIKGIYTTVERIDHQIVYEKMGFNFLKPNYYRGKIYHLDLMHDISKISWIMPEEDTQTILNKITYRQLSHDDILTEQQLIDIAALIWDSDAYIYPSIMSRKQAKKILPVVFSTNKDAMFSLNNIFAAICGRRIIGLILHKKGPLNWSSDTLRQISFFFNEKLHDTIDLCENNYFTLYNDVDQNSTSILNSNVHKNWSLRDISVETKMMSEFILKHKETLSLRVLQETHDCVRTYARNGFEISKIENGFSPDNHPLPCALMIKKATE